MIMYPDIDPVAFRVLGWSVHWYGIMYMLAFGCAAAIGRRLLRAPAFADLSSRLDLENLLLAGITGVLAGGRLGYVLFYKPAFYAAQPLQIIQVWDGGMSFHGGLLGVIAALWIYARRHRLPFLRVADFAAVLTPVGLGLGRIGNFINGELPGRVAAADLPWSMIFPHHDFVARHPSSLYQALLEGVVLGVLMMLMARRRRPAGFLGGVFLSGYALCRLFSEFFREPDAHLGLLLGGLSMGQWLSAPMLMVGIALLFLPQWGAAIKQGRD